MAYFESFFFLGIGIKVLQSDEAALESRGCQTCLHCFVRLTLNCIDAMLEYINQYGFVYVAVYGSGYMESSKGVLLLTDF